MSPDSTDKKSCFVAQIDLSLKEKLQNDLIDQGFQLTTPPYTLFSAQKKGVSCTLYTSGKLTVQGKDKEDFIHFYLEPEILKALTYSHPEIDIDLTPRIGIDEAGKGDFFGPLCIAGVYADETTIKELLSIGVKDSKTISDKNILILKNKIQRLCPHSIVRLPPKKYNELYTNFRNLNRLLGWGHATAICELVAKTGCHNVIIDQFANENVVESALRQKHLKANLTQKHKAESDPVVAAASILARAAFLEGLEKLGEKVGMVLPKGASQAVISAGKALVARQGEGILEDVAKLHFKTKDDVLR
jgi:ribonuclease HIII